MPVLKKGKAGTQSQYYEKGVLLMVPMKYKGLGFDRYDSEAYNKEAVATMKALVGEADKSAVWDVNTEEEYHEESK